MEIEAYLKKDYIASLAKQGKRTDGRAFDEMRPLTIENGYAKEKSPGSCMVHLGKTKVIAGISLAVGEPYSDRPNEGIMTTSAELRPIASPSFESGPPDDKSTELARVVDRGIRESKAIDTKKLVVEDGKVWVAFIDLHILDQGGNLIDAAGIAAMSALMNTRMPKYEDGRIIYGEYEGKLPMTCSPIPCTTVKIGESLLLDPVIDEEYAMDARLTVATTDRINAMQKGGFGALTEKEIDWAIDQAFEKGKAIRKQLEKD